ncbi:MAG: hypothetical protein PHR96_00705 [Clostridia bacterium]|nr:hypothetical protein [Clostridia bacterium]
MASGYCNQLRASWSNGQIDKSNGHFKQSNGQVNSQMNQAKRLMLVKRAFQQGLTGKSTKPIGQINRSKNPEKTFSGFLSKT